MPHPLLSDAFHTSSFAIGFAWFPETPVASEASRMEVFAASVQLHMSGFPTLCARMDKSFWAWVDTPFLAVVIKADRLLVCSGPELASVPLLPGRRCLPATCLLLLLLLHL